MVRDPSFGTFPHFPLSLVGDCVCLALKELKFAILSEGRRSFNMSVFSKQSLKKLTIRILNGAGNAHDLIFRRTLQRLRRIKAKGSEDSRRVLLQ